MIKYTHDEWLAEAKRRFGKKPADWVFVCPRCKTEQTVKDLMDAGVAKNKVEVFLAFSCIGRFTTDKGCNWTLGGLFRIHEAEITFDGDANPRPVFLFAGVEPS